MLDDINGQIKDAMKAKQKERLDALRFLKSKLLENKTAAKPKPELDVIVSHHKKLKDSLEHYQSDQTMMDKIQAEMAVVAEFMPQPLSEADVVAIINDIKGKLDNPQMGMIMKELQPQIKGRFDGKKASELVKAALN